jgi:hypothetical protein
MKTCNNCNINIDTPSVKCPICGSILVGKDKDTTYPRVKKKYTTFNRILMFILSVIMIINVYLDLQLTNHITWSKYVVFGCAVFYIVVRSIIRSHRNPMSLLTGYAFLLVVLLLIFFWLTKFYVITNFIIPILCLTELIISVFYALVVKNKYIKKYLSVIVTNMLVSFIPFGLMIFKSTTFNVLVNISYVLSIISFVGLIIFDYDDLKDELSKIFNY